MTRRQVALFLAAIAILVGAIVTIDARYSIRDSERNLRAEVSMNRVQMFMMHPPKNWLLYSMVRDGHGQKIRETCSIQTLEIAGAMIP